MVPNLTHRHGNQLKQASKHDADGRKSGGCHLFLIHENKLLLHHRDRDSKKASYVDTLLVYLAPNYGCEVHCSLLMLLYIG